MHTVEARRLAAVVDTDRYALADPGSAPWDAVVARVRADLRSSGCSVLRDFIAPHARDTLRQEGEAAAPSAYYDVETVNVYNTAPDEDLPADHPAHLTFARGNAFVARDLLAPDAIICRLYTHPLFRHFVASCFGLDRVHPLADPLSGLVVNVLAPGNEHPWHFDTNEFTVSMLTRAGQSGGVFEYCPGLRTPQAENLAEVRAVLTGRAGPVVHRLELRPGDLQLFQGRYSLHRVSEVGGSHARHCAIFAYSERPGVIGSETRTRQLFGRITPAHRAAREIRVDHLLD